MSERTISPGMEPTHSMPALTRMDDETASPAAGLSGPVKRKWSPDNSASSTGTVISRQETFLETETASAPGEGSPRGSKRARVDGAIPVRKLSADNETRIPADKSRLPPEMWQRIFSYLPPYSLGRLMCVNTIFRSLIAPSGEPPTAQLDGRGLLRLIEQDQLWSLSRRAFFPTMPRPLSSLSEFETWKLVRGSKCEFCGKANTSTIPPVSTSPWAAGPGNDYVRVIWPFAVRSCGNCLRIRLQKVGIRTLICATLVLTRFIGNRLALLLFFRLATCSALRFFHPLFELCCFYHSTE